MPIDQRNPFANFSSGSYANSNILSSYYNGLQDRFNERFYHGLTMMADYTYSKTMDMVSKIQTLSNNPGNYGNFIQDAHNLKADYGPADFN